MLSNAVFCRNCSDCVPLDRRLFFPKQHFFPSTSQLDSQYLERNLYLDMLEDSQLQIMRLGESNIRHFEDSDPQIFSFRCSKWKCQGIRSNKMLKSTRCFAEIAQIGVGSLGGGEGRRGWLEVSAVRFDSTKLCERFLTPRPSLPPSPVPDFSTSPSCQVLPVAVAGKPTHP